jgi:tetratricopeptide (TPR) repeat protein
MRSLILFTLLTAGTPAIAQQESDQPAIVVTGIRIQDFRDRLAACLARHCPANEDADATLALAEALFLDGEYADARGTVRASLSRNRDQASAFPEPVSDLYRAQTRLARHIGLDREARTAAHNILNALQQGIPQEDHRHFTARFEIAEMQMMRADFPGARRELAQLVRAARAAGREDVATIAELRDLQYELVAYPASDARGRLLEWSQRTAADQRMRAIGARILLARLYRDEGDSRRADSLLGEIGRSAPAGAGRRLIHAPAYQLAQQETKPPADQDIHDMSTYAMGRTLNRVTENYADKWIDVGFWVLPDGHVSGLEIVRRGAAADWAAPLLASIRGRTYSTASEASYRLERYSFTADFEEVTGTHIRRRSPRGRLEYLDLTVDAATPVPAPPPAGGTTR